MFLGLGNAKDEKSQRSEIFIKLYVVERKNKFISIEDYFVLLLQLYVWDFCIYLPVFEVKLMF